MPITPKQILEELNQDFNSSELETIYELTQEIDYKLQSTFTGEKCNVWFTYDKHIERVHPNRRPKLLNEVIKTYEAHGWNITIKENYFVINQK